MQHQNHTAPADTASPDADRVGPGASTRQPEWLVHVLALLILFLHRHWPHYAQRRLTPWVHDRPDLPAGSIQALAASIRGEFGNAIAWMCRRRGIGPGHQDWPELSRAIAAFGGSVKGFRAGLPPCGLQWWENRAIVPGMSGEAAPTPAADAIALLLSRQGIVRAPTPALIVMPAGAGPTVSPAPRRQILAHAATGPPTGPPSGCGYQPCHA